MANQDDYIKTQLRIPKQLHGRLQSMAEASGMSMNAQIIQILESGSPGSGASASMAEIPSLLGRAPERFVIPKQYLGTYAFDSSQLRHVVHRGSEMEPYLFPSDVLFADFSSTTPRESGQMFVLEIDGDVTVRFALRSGRELFLSAADPSSNRVKFDAKNMTIFGRVTHVFGSR